MTGGQGQQRRGTQRAGLSVAWLSQDLRVLSTTLSLFSPSLLFAVLLPARTPGALAPTPEHPEVFPPTPWSTALCPVFLGHGATAGAQDGCV